MTIKLPRISINSSCCKGNHSIRLKINGNVDPQEVKAFLENMVERAEQLNADAKLNELIRQQAIEPRDRQPEVFL